MRGKNRSRRLKLKRAKLHSLKLKKRRKTKKRGGAGSYQPGLKSIKEIRPKITNINNVNASKVTKRPLSKTRRKPSKTLAEVKPSSSHASSSPGSSEYSRHKKFVNTVKKAKKLKTPVVAEMDDYGDLDMAWL